MSAPGSFDAYARDREDARFTDWLRERSEPDWTATTTHRFVEELGDGALSEQVFARYLVQDYAFVETLVSLVGYGVGQAPDMESKARLTAFLSAITGDEDEYFRRSFEALGVPESRWADPEMNPTTAGFRDLILRAAHEGGYAETLAVLVPVEWSYLEWASAIEEPPEAFYFAEWVELHAIPEFESTVEWLRSELDTYGAACSERRQARLDALFSRAMAFEVDFFDAAFEST
ncbi:multifunctional thiamine-phosphate pyrophosphorylase/synthase/phosphomethylpyrimidine kinase [Halalkalicoccus paucihalophilus]|uniref:Multifunctional thiamine-phosphate pyrophosphorylase/synthase/phosphomethylpyrimidine kinase n=1 Tax=Halalkalicoccus paucihalophilus TaxID=1008153 RepID=A0A151AI55_9EURY|nr:TenA family protein [Halalkalicoccus paucihalophilus]KYH27190.1 multifunctional thiamine-phosphate pyrophosphorylase/synthase/phosphomethylpyrimidine kinase [Halalkalicoccus paucihalophilus]